MSEPCEASSTVSSAPQVPREDTTVTLSCEPHSTPPFAHEETESQTDEQLASTHALSPTPNTQQHQPLAAVGKVPGPEPSTKDIC